MRVGHAVEDHYEGIRGRQQVFQIDVGVRPNPRRHPLVCPAAGELSDPSLGDFLHGHAGRFRSLRDLGVAR